MAAESVKMAWQIGPTALKLCHCVAGCFHLLECQARRYRAGGGCVVAREHHPGVNTASAAADRAFMDSCSSLGQRLSATAIRSELRARFHRANKTERSTHAYRAPASRLQFAGSRAHSSSTVIGQQISEPARHLARTPPRRAYEASTFRSSPPGLCISLSTLEVGAIGQAAGQLLKPPVAVRLNERKKATSLGWPRVDVPACREPAAPDLARALLDVQASLMMSRTGAGGQSTSPR